MPLLLSALLPFPLTLLLLFLFHIIHTPFVSCCYFPYLSSPFFILIPPYQHLLLVSCIRILISIVITCFLLFSLLPPSLHLYSSRLSCIPIESSRIFPRYSSSLRSLSSFIIFTFLIIICYVPFPIRALTCFFVFFNFFISVLISFLYIYFNFIYSQQNFFIYLSPSISLFLHLYIFLLFPSVLYQFLYSFTFPFFSALLLLSLKFLFF